MNIEKLNIDELEAGRELDVLIAKTVMGYWQYGIRNLLPPGFVGSNWSAVARRGAPPYSTEIGAAWKVVEKLSEHCIVRISNGDGDSRDCDILPFSADGPYTPAHVSAETWELAICRAALKVYHEPEN